MEYIICIILLHLWNIQHMTLFEYIMAGLILQQYTNRFNILLLNYNNED
jgi:hypothetical protein